MPSLRSLTITISLLTTTTIACAAQPCLNIRGKATYYSGDSQFRIWRIGTHHTFRPDVTESDPDSWNKILDLITSNGSRPHGYDDYSVIANFVVCPTEPFREGASQPARVKSMSHTRLVKRAD